MVTSGKDAERISLKKKQAGFCAADMVQDGMTVGLGTGSTVFFAMERLSERILEGLRITGIPTSYQTSLRAREFGIPLKDLDESPEIDIAIDGADQVAPDLCLIKGRGAALTRERCVVAAAKRFVVVVDEEKISPFLSAPVPVEVIPFARSLTEKAVLSLGGTPHLREGVKKDGPVITDNGNWILDCDFGKINDPLSLQKALNGLPGVLGCGIFAEYGKKTSVVVGKEDGTEILS